jgi:hypothetical protein
MLDSLRAGTYITVMKTVVLLVVVVIVLDFWNPSCCSVGLAQANPSIYAYAREQADTCAGFCGADCFCCSRVSPPVTVSLAQEPTPSYYMPALQLRSLTTGVSRTLDHIPLTAD